MYQLVLPTQGSAHFSAHSPTLGIILFLKLAMSKKGILSFLLLPMKLNISLCLWYF